MKHYLKNLQGITLGHVDTVQSDICSNQLLRKVGVFLFAGLTQLILETQHSFSILSCHIQCLMLCEMFVIADSDIIHVIQAIPQGNSWPANVQKLQWLIFFRCYFTFFIFLFFFYVLYKAQYSCPRM